MTTMSAAAALVAREVTEFPKRIRAQPVVAGVSAETIRQQLQAYGFESQLPLEEVVADVARLLGQWTLHSTHPRYFGLFNPGVHEAGVWGDALAALYNPQLGAWWHAPAANEIERHTLAWLARLLGFDARAAHFTTGGSEANLTALLAALSHRHPGANERGLAADATAAASRIYLSSQAHHSFLKAVRVAGLGDAAIRTIPCTAEHRMDVAALGQAIAADRADGREPLMIVGTFGTTTAGALDDLHELGSVANRERCWFHVDAAWGGIAALSPALRPHLRGIDAADSITWDAHKTLSVPMGAGMFFCRHSAPLHQLFGLHTDYVPEESAEGDDLYRSSLQWSRRFIGLKVFMTLAAAGAASIAARVERQCEVAEHLRRALRHHGWRVANTTPLPLVCFTHDDLESDPARTSAFAKRVVARGEAWISAASLPEGPVLRACITHDDSTTDDADALVGELELARRG